VPNIKDDPLRVYCFECQVAACMMCSVTDHKSHECSDGVEKCRGMLHGLEKEMNDFDEQVVKAEMEISENAEQLKQMINVHREKLMNELSSMKQKRMKEIESLREEIETVVVNGKLQEVRG